MRPLLSTLLAIAFLLPGCSNPLTDGFDRVQPEDLIRSDAYTKWVIEVDYVEGQAPSQSAMDLLKTRMRQLVQKDSVQVMVDDRLTAGRSTWTDSAIQDLRDRNQDRKTSGDTVVTYMLYLDGKYQRGNVLGITFDYEMVAIFDKQIEAGANPIPLLRTAEAERAVVVHEFGHVIGLVNRGVPMVNDHEDDEHPRHSDNPDSVMYHAIETTELFNQFAGGPPDNFDADDRRDICDFGGKC